MLAGAFEQSISGMALLGPDNRFRAVNAAFCRLVGRSAEELVGLRPRDVTHPDDAAVSDELEAEFVASRTTSDQAQKRYLRPDGTVVAVVRTATAVRDDTGGLIGFFTQAVDVTEAANSREAIVRSDYRHRALVRHASEVIILLDRTGQITYASPAGERLMGYSPAALEGTYGFDWVHPDDRPTLEELFARHLGTHEVSPVLETRIVHADGTWRHTEVIVTNLLDDPDMEVLVVNIRDLTERHEAAARLQRRAAQQEAVARLGAAAVEGTSLGALFHLAVRLVADTLDVEHCSVVESDSAGRLHAAARFGSPVISGRFDGECGGHPASLAALAIKRRGTVLLDELDRSVAAGLHPGILDAGLRSGAAAVIAGQGRPFGALSTLSVRPDALRPGDLAFLEGMAHVLAGAVERQQAQDELRYRAQHDSLTGLPNRDLFMSVLAGALARTERSRGCSSLLFVDTDDFKVVNDSLGHDAGDQVVRAAASRIVAAVDGRGFVARFGGDEFVVLCEGCDSRQAGALADRIRSAMAEPVGASERPVILTVSIGIAATDARTVSADDLLAQADTAMYVAKRAGKDRAVVFDAGMRTKVTEWFDVTSSLRRSLSGDELRVFYQPVVATTSGRVMGAEALLRWQHPSEGLLGPDRFIAVAEDSGLIVPIGQWVLEQACRQSAAWSRMGLVSMTSINVSPRQLAEPDIVDTVAATLEGGGISPAAVSLEVTETAVMSDLERARAVIEQLQALGVRVGLDDFGTGYSSLSYLANLPFDFIKIDSSFIARINSDRRAAALLETIARLCDALQLDAVAEGVETEEQLRRVRDLGIAYTQGYLFGRPCAAEAFSHDRREV